MEKILNVGVIWADEGASFLLELLENNDEIRIVGLATDQKTAMLY